MAVKDQREYWLRGPVEGIPGLLQPVAHALLQARDEVTNALIDFPDDKLWEKPAGSASAGFHLQHPRGVLDRLFTYANNEMLNQQQLSELSNEGKPYEGNSTVEQLVKKLSDQVDLSLAQLKITPESILTEERGVGRAKIPSNVIGLLFHAAEHTMRHTGQLLVTVKVVKGQSM